MCLTLLRNISKMKWEIENYIIIVQLFKFYTKIAIFNPSWTLQCKIQLGHNPNNHGSRLFISNGIG
jgi:hypothetical protein